MFDQIISSIKEQFTVTHIRSTEPKLIFVTVTKEQALHVVSFLLQKQGWKFEICHSRGVGNEDQF